MPVVFLIAIAVVLAGIVLAATGRGGELAYEHADHAPLDLGPISAADIALLRPPTAMWGYNMQVTDEALEQIARAMRERDITIAYLQEQLASLERNDSHAEPRGAHARPASAPPYAPDFPAPSEATSSVQDPEIAPDPEIVADPEIAPDPEITEVPWIFDFAEAREDAESREDAEAREDSKATEDSEARDTPEATNAPEAAAALETPEVPEAAQPQEAPAVTQRQQVTQAADHPRTPLVLKASAVKAPPAPEPHEATQPNETLQQPHEATQPNETLQQPHQATQPNETPARHDQQGPQGSFDTHGWWAEQQQAEREECERDALPRAEPAAGDGQGPAASGDDPLAAAEEQAW